jgi:hypothetical protein
MKKKTKKNKPPVKVYLGWSITQELRDMVKKRAAKEERSVSSMASYLLSTALNGKR